MIKKIIKTEHEAREKLLSGVRKIGHIVGSTLGPAGRNVIIYRKYKPPLITNDGVTVARHIYFEDEIEDLGAQTIVEAAMKTNEQAGDSTTTSVVIATSIVEKCFDILNKSEDNNILSGGKVNVMSLKRQIDEAKEKVIEALKAAKPLKGQDLSKIISTSLENLEIGTEIGKMMKVLGLDGYISTEDNWATKYGVETEITTGMKKLGTYASPYLANSRNQKEAIWEDTLVLVTNEKIESVNYMANVLKQMQDAGKTKLVIVNGYSEGTDGYSKQFIQSIANAMIAAAKGNSNAIQILAIKAPSLTSPELEDIAVFCDGLFYDKNLNRKLKDLKIEELGFAKKFVVDESDFTIIGGRGKTEERIKVLQEQAELEKDQMFKEKMKRRIASLSSGIGIIRVGAMTESERDYLKLKIEDAVNAARSAMEEGTIKGGGLALKEIAEQLGEDDILYEPLMSPYNKIQENAGGNLEIKDDVLDPAKSIRLAFENACSAAGVLITTETAISERKKSLWDELEKIIDRSDERHSFRDAENMDAGIGRINE